eukprot:SAG31_NODE_15_length_37942_cov_32.078297_3_plen_462_part_00
MAVAALQLLLSLLVQFSVSPSPGDRASWMEVHWAELKGLTLLNVTLPGSHNSGNVDVAEHRLGTGPSCPGDNKYAAFDRAQRRQQTHGSDGSLGGHQPLNQSQFDAAFLPWNFNHQHDIMGQLQGGIRFFHLKLCWIPRSDDSGLSLSDVWHYHRGYTSITASSILDNILTFLSSHPKEIVVIGLNNLHGFGHDDTTELARLIQETIQAANLRTVTPSDLVQHSLDSLVSRQARVAIFLNGAPPDDGVLASSQWLYEQWDDVMESGDLRGSQDWLKQDVAAYATRHDRFYVLQANPNNAESYMYTDISEGDRSSLLAWEGPFLKDLSSLVAEMKAQNPTATINAISTDYQDASDVVNIALQFAGLAVQPNVGLQPTVPLSNPVKPQQQPYRPVYWRNPRGQNTTWGVSALVSVVAIFLSVGVLVIGFRIYDKLWPQQSIGPRDHPMTLCEHKSNFISEKLV